MKKLTLDLDTLHVNTFLTQAEQRVLAEANDAATNNTIACCTVTCP
ncbi:MAG TPA: hypothetical protein VF092_04695 [Longimicrobium sp.]